MLKTPANYDRDNSPAKLTDISRQTSSDLLLGVCALFWERALVEEPGTISNQMGTHNRSERSSGKN